MDLGAVRLLVHLAGSEPVAHDHGPVDRREIIDASVGDEVLDLLGQRLERHAGEQVVQRDEAVGLAAAEVGLAVDDRLPALPADPLDAKRQQLPQPDGQVGALEEQRRVDVLRRCPRPCGPARGRRRTRRR